MKSLQVGNGKRSCLPEVSEELEPNRAYGRYALVEYTVEDIETQQDEILCTLHHSFLQEGHCNEGKHFCEYHQDSFSFGLLLTLYRGAAHAAEILTFPASLRTIEDEVFIGDTALELVIIPDGIEHNGECAVANSSLVEI